MKHYTQLTCTQRYQIFALLEAGQPKTAIARILGVHRSTITRELKRHQTEGKYCPEDAQRSAQQRRQGKTRISLSSWQIVQAYLRLDWSPEQISCYLKAHGKPSISHTYIYHYIRKDKAQGGDLYRHLRHHKRTYRKRQGKAPRIGNRVSIEKRPAMVEKRERLGDWEIDTIVGKNHRQAIVTLSERKSRLTLMAKLTYKSAALTQEAVIKLLLPLKEHVHTITSDNGMEFSHHEKIAKALEADYYFARPYASWQRGSNENANGLIRQYLPKGCDFDLVSEEEILQIMARLNHRPRKCLDMKTPYEVFFS